MAQIYISTRNSLKNKNGLIRTVQLFISNIPKLPRGAAEMPLPY